jgi:peptidoglycan/xylan/chitin deacetylase (PgdA/CDA1 family)
MPEGAVANCLSSATRPGARALSDVLVLCYHAVSPTWSAPLSVTPEALASQLGVLVRRGWRGATFRDAVIDPPARRTLAVTFDDAFLSVLERAYPILADLGVPGTVFVPTAFSTQRQHLSWAGIDRWSRTPDSSELQCMSWDDLGRLVDSGWEIGSHTRTHPRLTQLDGAALGAELGESRRECIERLGGPCDSIAYPYGDVDERVAQQAAAAGYLCGASLSTSLAPLGVYRWPRVGVYHRDPLWRFQLKVNGLVRRARASKLWPAHE